ncbi:MAG: GAF domain-containing protein [Spirochaetia bacterium]|nr:GAF domain-containing protein [Spirochaetia bacterium]
MGLLDKALNFRSGGPKRGSGLLERAKKLKDFVQGKDKTGAQDSDSPSKRSAAPGSRGLFKRATAARTPPPSEISGSAATGSASGPAMSAPGTGGLLKRAQGLQDSQPSVTPEVSTLPASNLAAPIQDHSQAFAPEGQIDFSSPDLGPNTDDELFIAPAPAEFAEEIPAHESIQTPAFDASDFAHHEPLGEPTILDIDLPELPESHAPVSGPVAHADEGHESAKSGGLLARAEQFKDEPASHAEWSSELAEPSFDPTLDWDSGDTPELDLPDFDSQKSSSGMDSDRAEVTEPAELPGLWNELDTPANDADLVDRELSQADDVARQHAEVDLKPNDTEDAWDDMSDPFSSFEQEAEKAAERELATDDKPHEEKVQPSFLFDADDDFTTAPIEAHIAGQKKIDHYLSLFDIQREISSIDNFEEFWDAVLFAVMGQLGAETVCILASRNGTEGGQTFLPVAYSGMEIGDKWALGPGDTLYDAAAREDGVMYAESFRNLSDAMTLTEIERDMIVQSRAQIIAPLKNNGKMYGIVFLGSTHSGEDYGIDDLEFVTLLGGIAASGVDRIIARLEFARGTEVLKKRDYFHNRILEAARECSSGANLDELYDIVGRNLTEHFSVDSYSIVLLNPPTQEYSIFAGNRISPESIEKFKLRTTSELIGMVSNFTRVFEISDFRTNSELTACYTNDDLGIMKSYWIVPLIYQNWLVGFITIHSTRAPWGEFEREMMVSFAELVGASFGGAIMMGERESLFRDPFSPLEDRLRVELGRAFEFHSHLSLAELRIKNIKRILTLNPSANVTQFLASVGRTISGFLFQTDFLARIGQGRFALILPGRGKEEAEILIKKIRNDIKRLHLLPGSPVDAQFVHTIVSTDDTHDPEKMLAILE